MSPGWDNNNSESFCTVGCVLIGESLRLDLQILVLGNFTHLWRTRHHAADRNPPADSITAFGILRLERSDFGTTAIDWPALEPCLPGKRVQPPRPYGRGLEESVPRS